MREIVNDGAWPPIMTWLDSLQGGHFSIPFGSRPPVRRFPDGSLAVDTPTGVEECRVGDTLGFDVDRGFLVMPRA